MEKATSVRRAYKKPQATKLTLEQARLKLLWRSAEGNIGATELLQLLYPHVAQQAEKKKLDKGMTPASPS
jgi:hypothetical protein